MTNPGGLGDTDQFGRAGSGQLSPPIDYPHREHLSSSPFYLPNVIAALVASLGIVIGCITPWATLDAISGGGLELFKPWSVVALVLGAASGVALFGQVNWGRTSVSLRWSVSLCWLVVVAGIACLAIALVFIVRVRSVGELLEGEGLLTQVGWGLWLVAISSAILCATAAIVAGQVAKAYEAEAAAIPQWPAVWRWVATIGSALILVVALFNGYSVSFDAGSETTTQVVTKTAPPVTVSASAPSRIPAPPPRPPRYVVPADSTPCPQSFSDGEFSHSAVGSNVTTCQFAEAVRREYIRHSFRNGPVRLDVFSPVTKQSYVMSCDGGDVVRCTGGNNAVVYLY